MNQSKNEAQLGSQTDSGQESLTGALTSFLHPITPTSCYSPLGQPAVPYHLVMGDRKTALRAVVSVTRQFQRCAAGAGGQPLGWSRQYSWAPHEARAKPLSDLSGSALLPIHWPASQDVRRNSDKQSWRDTPYYGCLSTNP